jgi:archaellum component FlaF (FlaF/FlaG flagellin family)
MKGISTIIASIILVVITIGLISVAYLYMSGLITGATSKNLSLSDAYCDSNTNTIYALIKNDGTVSVAISDIKFYIDGSSVSAGVCTGNLAAGATTTCSLTTTTGQHELRIIGPSNALPGSIRC